MRERDDYKKKGNRASVGPQDLGKPKNGKYRCESPGSTVRPFRCHATTGNSGSGAVLSGPSYSPHDRPVTRIGNEVRSVHTDQEV